MNDYYSQFLGPTKYQAINEIQQHFCIESEWFKQKIDELITHEIEVFGSLGSQTGWYVMVKPTIILTLKEKLIIHERSQKLLVKLFYHFKVFGVFLKLYKDVYFKPNGSYMKSIEDKFKKYF